MASVAQASEPAVSRVSNLHPLGLFVRREVRGPADWEVGDTAGLSRSGGMRHGVAAPCFGVWA